MEKIIEYSVGIVFNQDLTEVILILKNRPKWQNGKFNFPGGHVELNESSIECIVREFQEECNLTTKNWKYIGNIENANNYTLDIFVLIYEEKFGKLKSLTDEPVHWHKCNELPDNCITNLYWLIPFAKNFIMQGNADHLVFGKFIYENI
jgi:mutator protein MutT